MNIKEIKKIADDLSEIIVEAGQILISEFQKRNFTIKTKQDNSPVTEVDIKINEYIVNKIQILYPNFGIISEESTFEKNKEQYGEYNFIIDPLDSTKNFIQGIPFFDISIALYNYDEPLLGLVLDPIHDELFKGIKNGGSFLNDTPIRCNDKNQLNKLNVDINIARLPNDKFNNINEFITKDAYKVRYFGNAVLEICWISCGKLDVMINHDLSIWDLGACGLILEEAGGRWTKLDGEKPSVQELKKFPIIAANSNKTHGMILNLINNGNKYC